MEVSGLSNWDRVGQKLALLESLYHHVAQNCAYLANSYQGVPKYNYELNNLLEKHPELYLPSEYYLFNLPWTSATIEFLRSSDLPPDQWVPIEYPVPIIINYYTFSRTLEHLSNFLKLMSGGTFYNSEVLSDIGELPESLVNDGWAYFEKYIDLYLRWLEAITKHCNVQYYLLKYSSVLEYWTRIGEKVKQLGILYNEVVNSCRGLTNYNLMPLETPWQSYSFQEVMEHIGVFFKMINGENLDNDTLDDLIDTGFLIRIFDIMDQPIFPDHPDDVRYEADEILNLYIRYLEDVLNQCQRNVNIIRNAQERFLERRYEPSGQLSQQTGMHFYNLAK